MATGSSSDLRAGARESTGSRLRRLGWLTLLAFTLKGLVTTALIVSAVAGTIG